MQPGADRRPVQPCGSDTTDDSHFSPAFVPERFAFASGPSAIDGDGALVGGNDGGEVATP